MSSPKQLAEWRDQLAQLLVDIADLTSLLGVEHRSDEMASLVEPLDESQVREALARIKDQVRSANAAAEQLLAADPGMAEVVHPLLNLPGEKPVVDLRPWWSRMLDAVSRTAKRGTVAQSLETLRLEADAAMMRAFHRLVRLAAAPAD